MGVPLHWRDVEWREHVHGIDIDGAHLRYVDYGSGPPLLLVHGMAGSWQNWLANLTVLGENHRVIAVDLPGFGGSDRLPDGSDFGRYAVALTGLLDHLGLSSVAVFGHSLGGLVALSLAVEAPERVRSVVLVSGAGIELAPLRLRAIQSAFSALRMVLAVPLVRDRLMVDGPLGALLMMPVVHNRNRVSADLLRELLPRTVGPGFTDAIRLSSTYLATFEAGRVRPPVLLVWGAHDRILPVAVGQRLATELPRAQMVVLNDVAHCTMLEAPYEFNVLVNTFLAQQRSDRHGREPGRATAESWTGQPMAAPSAGEPVRKRAAHVSA